MSGSSTPSADPLQLVRAGWEAIVRHRRRAIGVFVGIAGLAVVAALLQPRVYESAAKMHVKIGRESVTLDPTATVGQTLSVYDSRETEVNTILEIIGSRVVLEDVATAIGPGVVLGRESGNGEATPADLERAVKTLEETTAVERGRKANVVTVVARAASAELAQRIASTMLDAFRDRYLMANRTAGSHAFFVEQEKIVARELADATADLNEVRNELGVGSIDDERRRIETQLTTIGTDRSTNATALAAAEARIDALALSIATLPERTITSEVTGFAEDAAGRTRQQLYLLKLEEHALLSRLQPSHPDVAAVHERIERAQEVLARIDGRNTQTTTVANPAREQLELELLRERSNAEALRGRRDELDVLEAGLLQRMRRLNDAEGDLTRLSQRVQRLQADHRDYAQKLEQARIDRALAEERISNVNVFQPPTLIEQPVGSKRRLIVMLGLVLAVLTAVATAVVSEYLARRGSATDFVPAESPLSSRLGAAMNR